MNRRLDDVLLVAACYIGIAVSMFYLYMMGSFFIPLQEDLGWTRSQVASGLFLSSVMSVLGAPLVGMAIDRFGSRPFAIGGLCMYCAAICGLALANSPVAWLLGWLLLSLGSLFIKPPVWLAIIAKRFEERRGLVMGVALSGTGVAGALVPVLASSLIDMAGWRWAFVGIGLGAAVVALPFTLLFFRDKAADQSGSKAPEKAKISFHESLLRFKSAQFLFMVAAGFLASFSIMGLTVHFIPIVLSFSSSQQSAALISSSIGVFSVIGRLLVGYLLDIWSPRVIGVFALCLPGVAALLLLWASDPSLLFLFTAGALIGISLGAEVDVLSFLTARFFGPAVYGTMFGTLMGFMSLGLGSGPAFAAVVYDYWGQSYSPVLVTLGLVSLASAGCLWAAISWTSGTSPSYSTAR